MIPIHVLIGLALGAFALQAQAQNSLGQAAAPGANPIVTEPSNESALSPHAARSPRKSRVISPEIAAQLSAATPKFIPPPPKAETPPEDDQTDLRDVDKPKNGIIRLPKYVVTQPRPPVLSERAVYTKTGLADLAMKRYLTEGYRAMNRYTLPLFGTAADARAMQMYEEDERLKNIWSLNEDARMVSSSDKAAGLYVKRQVQETYMHAPDFDWKPIGR